jgi:hypothetical protein
MRAVRLQGGLGNQLFQVAFAHRMARLSGRTSVLDVGWYQGEHRDQPRELEIVPAVTGLRSVSLPSWVYGRGRRVTRRFMVVERFPADDVEARVRPSSVVVIGYFQQARTVLGDADRMAAVVAAHLPRVDVPGGPYVAVHVRLGDYLSNPVVRETVGVTDPSWSLDMAARLAEELSDSGGGTVGVRVFTDEPERFWSLVGHRSGVVVDDSTASWDVLARMSRGAGLVMSNSSLSWWSGFTVRHVHRSAAPVIMPRPWFSGPSHSDDLLAIEGWRQFERDVLPSA